MQTSTAFPAGATILVYAATEQWAIANVNDTSVTAAVNSGWYMHWITVS